MELGKLEIYQLALKLSEAIWNIYETLANNLKYNIGDQSLRSIDSIGANIAEGYGRFHYKDSMKFYYNARGSLWESKHWIYLLIKTDYLDHQETHVQTLVSDIEEIVKLLSSIVKSSQGNN